MTNPPGDRELDAAMSDPVLANLFNDLQAVATEPAPAIGDALAAVLAGATPLSLPTRRARARRAALVALASTGVLAAGIGAAAATDRLPAPLQRVVAKVVNDVTPFDIPSAPVEPTGPSTTGKIGDVPDPTASRSGSSQDDASKRADDREDTGSDDDARDDDTVRTGDDSGDDSDGGDDGSQSESDGSDGGSGDGSDSGSDGSSDGSDSGSDSSESSVNDGSDNGSDSGSDSSDGSDSGSDSSDG